MIIRRLHAGEKTSTNIQDSHRRNLKKGRLAKKSLELQAALYRRIKEARHKGYDVDLHWLWSKARVIHKGQTGLESNQIKSRKTRHCPVFTQVQCSYENEAT